MDTPSHDPLHRLTVPAIDSLLGHRIPVLDQGFIRVIDYMGSDASIVQAARISYGVGTKQVHEDRGLIRYLMRMSHTTPFEMCLGGDTKIPTMPCFGATQKFYTIRELALAMAFGGKTSSWVKLVHIRTADPVTGQIVGTKIRRVWKSGERNVYRVTESSFMKRTIVVTENHPFLTDGGEYKCIAELGIGGPIYLNGLPAIVDDERQRICALRRLGQSIDTIHDSTGRPLSTIYKIIKEEGLHCRVPRKNGFLKKPIGEHADPRAIARRRFTLGLCVLCGDPGKNRHHVDENPSNNEPENIVLLCIKCHRVAHRMTPPKRIFRSTICSIKYIGTQDVYDLEVEHPNHNFVADGFIVHNCELKLHVRVPMDTWRQWIRTRTASVNEYSTRYSEAIDAMQETLPQAWRQQSPTNRQGSSEVLEYDTVGGRLTAEEYELHRHARKVYQDRLAAGVAREQARKDLPLSTYTEAYWKIDLHNLFHFLQLRMDTHAQEEIRAYATIIGEQIVQAWCPLAWEAFVDYRLKGLHLSRLELLALHDAIARMKAWLPEIPTPLLQGREIDEFAEKLRRIEKGV